MRRPIAGGVAVGVAMVALATSGCLSRPELLAEERCDWPEPVVVAGAARVPVQKFADIDTNWTLARIFARLGPAQREIGAGAYTYEWDANDGRVFEAAAASRCGIVRKAQFVR